MKIILITIVFSIVLFACKSRKEIGITQNNQIISDRAISTVPLEFEDSIIIVKEENVTFTEDNYTLTAEDDYFVIMGSFKVLNNAKNFNLQMINEGFNAQILQNDNGFYRVSIFTFKEVIEAREKVYFIRKNHPQYDDVWILKKFKSNI